MIAPASRRLECGLTGGRPTWYTMAQTMHSARIPALLALVLASATAAAQESAIDAARSAAAGNASDPTAAVAYGSTLRRAGRFDDATRELRRAANLARSADATIAVQWELARVAIDRRDFQQAMAACKVVLAQQGGAARGHACAAEAHLLWRRGTEAITEAAAALAGGNKLYEAKVAEARAQALMMKDTEADAAFKEAISWKPDEPEAHLFCGKWLVEGGKADAGIAELKLAVQKDPRGAEAAYELGRAMPVGIDGLAQLERAVNERPGYTAALVRQAEVLVALGRVAEARKAAEAAQKTGVQDASIPLALGRVALGENKPDEALAAAQKALSIMANSAPAKLLQGDAHAAKKDIDLALEAYQAAYGLDHTNPDVLVHAGRACLDAGRVTSGKAYGDKATKEFPTHGAGWVLFGDALVLDKEPKLAKAAYENALKLQGVDLAAVKAKLAAIK